METIFIMLIYFIPTMVAMKYDAEGENNNFGAVVFINILLGWTGIGWLFALFLATRTFSD